MVFFAKVEGLGDGESTENRQLSVTVVTRVLGIPLFQDA